MYAPSQCHTKVKGIHAIYIAIALWSLQLTSPARASCNGTSGVNVIADGGSNCAAVDPSYTSATGQTTWDAQTDSSITADNAAAVQASGDNTNALNVQSGGNIAASSVLVVNITGNNTSALNIESGGNATITGPFTIDVTGDNSSALNLQNGSNLFTTGDVIAHIIGTYTNPLNMQSGSHITAGSININVNGGNTNAFNIQGNIEATTLTANITGDNANVINLQAGGNIATTGAVAVTMSGMNSNAFNIGGTATIGAITANITGSNNHALNIQTGGSVTATGAIAVSIMNGDNTNALNIQSGSSISAADTVTINMNGNNVNAMNLGGSTALAGPVAVTITGDNANAFHVQSGSNLTATHAITTHISGNNATAFQIHGNAVITGPVDVTIAGDNANGVNVDGHLTAAGVTIDITGDNAHGLLTNGGNITAQGVTTLHMNGQNSSGLSTNNGAISIVGPLNITTSGDNSNALNTNGGDISISGLATLKTTGENSFGAAANANNGSTQINFDSGADITTSGSSHGIIALLQGNITSYGPFTVHTSGMRAFGAAAFYSSQANIHLKDNVTITAAGSGTSNTDFLNSGPGGLAALLGGIIVVDGETVIHATGNYASGLTSAAGQLTLNRGATINMTGTYANGLWISDAFTINNLMRNVVGFAADSPNVNDPGTLTLHKSWYITTTAQSSHGAHLSGKNSQLFATDNDGQGVIHAQGTALRLDSENSMALDIRNPDTGAVIPGGYGIAKRSTGLQASLLNATLTSVAGNAIEVAGVGKNTDNGDYSRITLSNSNVTAASGQRVLDVGSQTISFFNNNTNQNETTTFTTDGFSFVTHNTTLTGDIAIGDHSQNINLLLDQGTQLSGNINIDAVNNLMLTANHAVLNGNITVGSGSSNITLSFNEETQLISDIVVSPDSQNVRLLFQNTYFTGKIDPTDISLDTASTWTMPASSMINTLTLAGTVISTPASTNTLVPKTLALNHLVGQNGTVKLNANPGVSSDQIIIDGGTVNGTTTLYVVDTAERGAFTTADGVPIVQSIHGAVIPQGSFVLRQRIAAGAYNYTLQNTADGSSTISATLRTPSGSIIPNYRPAVAVDMVAQPLASYLSLNMLDSYRQRSGEYNLNRQDPKSMNSWGRIFGMAGNIQPTGNFSLSGPTYDFNTSGFQIGRHFYHRQTSHDASQVMGAYLGVSTADSTIEVADQPTQAGKLSMQAYTLGMYWTQQASNGWYTDVVLQVNRYTNIHGQSSLNENMHSNGWGTEASIESGLPIALPKGLTLEPQLQLIYQYQKLNDAQDDFGKISYDNLSATYGRIGARLSTTWSHATQRHSTAWLGINLWGNLSGQGTTTFTNLAGKHPTTLHTDLGGFWGQFELGVSGQLTKKTKLFLSAQYNRSLDTNSNRSYSGRLSVLHSW